jgi:phage terminase large subunit
VTYEKHVLPVGWLGNNIKWRTQEQEYRYPNKSVIAVGGMDKASKIMSSEWDTIYVQEAIELTEEDWESALSRLRNGKTPLQRLIGDTNPANPHHWLKKRCDRGDTRIVYCKHEDNPILFNPATKEWTKRGKAYIAILDKLTGIRYKRLRLGLWVAAEGLVYDGWNPEVHLINRFDIPSTWPRYWAIDFGYTNAFVCQWWAEDPDGRLYRYREIYKTQTLVEDHAREIMRLSAGEPAPSAVICDHDAEGRATLEKHTGYETTPAHKAVSEGIQAVQSRLRPAGDAKPRLFILRDSTVERDTKLDDKKFPASTEEEVEEYVWDTAGGRKMGEDPVKRHDHGLDALRYQVAFLDCDTRTDFELLSQDLIDDIYSL